MRSGAIALTSQSIADDELELGALLKWVLRLVSFRLGGASRLLTDLTEPDQPMAARDRSPSTIR